MQCYIDWSNDLKLSSNESNSKSSPSVFKIYLQANTSKDKMRFGFVMQKNKVDDYKTSKESKLNLKFFQQ